MSGLCGGSDHAEDSVEESSDSTEIEAISATCPEHFVILLGAPGIYDPEDPSHDQTWWNFFVLIQVAFIEKLVVKRKSECIDWYVYGTAYEKRWEDDKKSGRETQINDAKKYKKGYLYRIQEWINEQEGHNFYNFSNKSQFLDALKNLNPGTLTRIWFSGHASRKGLWLDLEHNASHEAVNSPDKILSGSEIAAAIEGKVKKVPGISSKLYGCSTSETAKTISKKDLIVEGAKNKIHFGYIVADDIGDGKVEGNHLQRIENGTIGGVSPEWTKHGK